MAFLVNDHGYIVYERDTNRISISYLEKIRKDEAEKINKAAENVLSITTNKRGYFSEAGQKLIDLGIKEEARERALIDKVFGVNTEKIVSEADFIKAFNEIMIGKERFEQAVYQIKLALEKKTTGKVKKQLAPTISSLYLSKLNQKFGEKVNEYIHKHQAELLNGDTSKWERDVESIFLESASEALEALLSYTNKTGQVDIFGTYIEHEELFEQYVKDMNARAIFSELIKKKVDLKKMTNLMRENLETIQKRLIDKTRMSGWTWAKNALGVSNARTGQIGGTVDEFLNQLAQQVGGSVNLEGGRRAARVFLAETQKIDNVLLISTEADLDLNKILEELDTELGKNSSNLLEAAKNFSDYYENNLKNLTDSFIIYTSGKAYGLNDYSSMGFTNDSKRSIQDLPAIFSFGQEGNAYKRAQDFIDVVSNTLEGAIMHSKLDQIKEALRVKIYESLAYLMFDDWISLGSEVNTDGANAIHAVTLNDVIIPISVLLKGAGEALKKAQTASTDWFRVKIMYQEKAIKYKDPKDYPEGNKNNKFPRAQAAWEDQRQVALDNITFTTHFMSNFWNYINNGFKIGK